MWTLAFWHHEDHTATRRRARPNLSGMTLLEQLVVPSPARVWLYRAR